MKSILDSAFRYTPSAQTDLRKTFARLKREQAAADKKRVADSKSVIVLSGNVEKLQLKARG